MLRKTAQSAINLHSSTLLLVVLLATIGALFYFAFLIRPSNQGDLLPYIMVITADSFIIFHALTAMWLILAGTLSPRNFEFHYAQAHLFSHNPERKRYEDLMRNQSTPVYSHQIFLHRKPVQVDVFITVYGEPIEHIQNTVLAAREMAGRHTTYIMDDGGSDEVRQLARDLNIQYIRREESRGAKSGNINNALRQTSGDFFIIFEADFIPKKNYLYEALPFFEDEDVAFVQTSQYYSNKDTLISRGASYMQACFTS